MIFGLFILGVVIGSFINAAIYRLPRGYSMLVPRVSYCDHCLKPLTFQQLVPVISFLMQKGRCTSCGSFIGYRSIFIELLNGFLPLIAFYMHEYDLVALLNTWVFLIYLLMVSVIDFDFRIIPDSLHSLLMVPLFLSVFSTQDPSLSLSMWSRILGAVLGGGVLWGFAKIYERFSGIEGMGMGDIKMMVVLGAWFGPLSILPTLLVSSIVGSLFGLTYIFFKGRSVKLAVPFGPFLSLGALIYFLFSDDIYRVLLGESFYV